MTRQQLLDGYRANAKAWAELSAARIGELIDQEAFEKKVREIELARQELETAAQTPED